MELANSEGWWDVPALDEWKCPECGEVSLANDWREVEPGCEDCGSHDGRACPKCDAWFDHVWGSSKIAEAQEVK